MTMLLAVLAPFLCLGAWLGGAGLYAIYHVKKHVYVYDALAKSFETRHTDLQKCAFALNPLRNNFAGQRNLCA